LASFFIYCLDVAHVINSVASFCSLDETGIANAHAHNHCEPFGCIAIGVAAKPILSKT